MVADEGRSRLLYGIHDSDVLTDADKAYFDLVLAVEVSNADATSALYQLSDYLYRAIMTGITRVSRESMFSDHE